jgi:hypothetical protein
LQPVRSEPLLFESLRPDTDVWHVRPCGLKAINPIGARSEWCVTLAGRRSFPSAAAFVDRHGSRAAACVRPFPAS